MAEELAAVRQIIELREGSASFRAIADELEGAACPTMRGGRWEPRTVQRIWK